MSYSQALPTAEEALAYPLPKDHWLQAVKSYRKEKDEKGRVVHFITSMHLINGDGKLVCGCTVLPPQSAVEFAAEIPAGWVHLYCDESVTYLTRVVNNLITRQRKANGNGSR